MLLLSTLAVVGCLGSPNPNLSMSATAPFAISKSWTTGRLKNMEVLDLHLEWPPNRASRVWSLLNLAEDLSHGHASGGNLHSLRAKDALPLPTAPPGDGKAQR